MSPLSLKRLFAGKGKSQPQLSALCIGEYARLAEQIPADHNYHELESLLAGHERGQGEAQAVGPVASQASPVLKSGLGSSAQSFRGLQSFKHLLQHLGGAGRDGAGPAPQAEGDAQQQLAQFVKQLGGGASEVSFVTAAEDGLLSRERVLQKLTKLFKHSTAPVVVVTYCGPSDERGNWRFPTQQAAGTGGGGAGAGSLPSSSSLAAAPGSPVTGGGASSSGGGRLVSAVVSFREVSMLWQRYRKHSQRLVLLLDCANSGYWVSGLRLLSKAEQLELSLGVQASDCSAPAVADRQLNYMPGIFTQLFLSNNKWRRAPRPNAGGTEAQQHQQQLSPAAAGAGAAGPAAASAAGGGGGARAAERWLPGMLPSYYATWLNDNLVDYGIALRFFNCNVAAVAAHTPLSQLDSLPAADPSSPVTLASGSARRASTIMMAAAEGAASLARPSRQGDAALMGSPTPSSATGPSGGGVWSPMLRHADTAGHLEDRVGGAGSGGGGELGGGSGILSAAGELGPAESPTGGDTEASRAAMSMRAASVPDAARRRFSSLADYYVSNPSSGTAAAAAGGASGASATGLAMAANSPIHSQRQPHQQPVAAAATAVAIPGTGAGLSASQRSQSGADARTASSGGIGSLVLQRLLGSPTKSQSHLNVGSRGAGNAGGAAGGAGAPSEPGVSQDVGVPGQFSMPQQDFLFGSPGNSVNMRGATLPGEHFGRTSNEPGGLHHLQLLQQQVRAASGGAAHVGVAVTAATRSTADSMPHIMEAEPADDRDEEEDAPQQLPGQRQGQQPAQQAWAEQQEQQQELRARSGVGALEAGAPVGAAADAARRAGAAVRPWEVEIEVEDAADAEAAADAGYEAGAGAAATGDSNIDSGVGMAVQPSARSDTAAVAWGRRSTRADRDMLLAELDERNAGSTASFTVGGGGGGGMGMGMAGGGGGGGGGTAPGGGFANQLYGALHEVATEQRLWGRRAPLEGDESMGDMMRDVELDRRASNVSLPSFMLPRAQPLSGGPHGAVAAATGGGGGDAGGDASAGAASVLSMTMTSTDITGMMPLGSSAAGAAAGAAAGKGIKAGTRAPVATPRMSGLGALGSASGGGGGSAATGGGSGSVGDMLLVPVAGRQSVTTPRQASRLFMTSTANASVVGAAGASTGGTGGGSGGDNGGTAPFSLTSGLLMTDPEMELAMEAEAAAGGPASSNMLELISGQVPSASDPAALSALVAAAIGGGAGGARPRVQTPAALEGVLRQMQAAQAAAGGGASGSNETEGAGGSASAADGGASLGLLGSVGDDGSLGLSGGGLFDAAMQMLMKQADALVAALPEEAAEMTALASPAGAAAAGSVIASGRARPGTPSALAVDSPQPCASPSLSPMASGIERRRLRASGAGALQSRDSGPLGLGPAPAASVMLRSLLKQHVSIADSMELDSVLDGSPSAGGGGGDGGGRRRAGRFEMGGSESSSFVFGDDRDRFEVLRMMRDYQGDLAQEEGDTDMAGVSGGGGGGGGGGGRRRGGDGDGEDGEECPMPPTRSRGRRGGGDGDGEEEGDDQFEDEDDTPEAAAERFRQATAAVRAAAAAALAAEEAAQQHQEQGHCGAGPPPPSNRGGEVRMYGALRSLGEQEEQQQQQQYEGHDAGTAVGVREAAARVAAVAQMLQGDESAQYGYTGDSGTIMSSDMEGAATGGLSASGAAAAAAGSGPPPPPAAAR